MELQLSKVGIELECFLKHINCLLKLSHYYQLLAVLKKYLRVVFSESDFSKKFVDLTNKEQDEVLNKLSAEAKDHEGDYPHIFDVIRDMTVYGFFTSETGAKSCLIYDPIPGDHQGCIDYSEVNGVWALS